MTSSFVAVDAGEGETLQVLQDRLRVLATGENTGGQYEIFELRGPRDSGPPSHSHPWDEAYFMLEGEVEVRVGDRTLTGTPGCFALAPAGTPHSYRIVSPTARFLVFTAKSGAAAFFRSMDREIGFPPPSFEAVVGVAVRQGLRLEGPPPAG